MKKKKKKTESCKNLRDTPALFPSLAESFISERKSFYFQCNSSFDVSVKTNINGFTNPFAVPVDRCLKNGTCKIYTSGKVCAPVSMRLSRLLPIKSKMPSSNEKKPEVRSVATETTQTFSRESKLESLSTVLSTMRNHRNSVGMTMMNSTKQVNKVKPNVNRATNDSLSSPNQPYNQRVGHHVLPSRFTSLLLKRREKCFRAGFDDTSFLTGGRVEDH
ncbi:hypothetical protein E2986_11581 [Frieseomelitta varia]|uniref:Uncharacterized protein n=1 Tax=Frieseomelitta varia TaxID=561572 RepID=A0A833W0L6_9HYME|nr:hypothetical protein E2986_11581 [Frieseomelitta varia]